MFSYVKISLVQPQEETQERLRKTKSLYSVPRNIHHAMLYRATGREQGECLGHDLERQGRAEEQFKIGYFE